MQSNKVLEILEKLMMFIKVFLGKVFLVTKKITIIIIKAIKKYLTNRIFIRRILAKIIDIIFILMIFIISFIVVFFISYLHIVNVELIMTKLLELILFISFVMTLFISIIYYSFFSFGRKITSIIKISDEKTYYSEPIFHFNLLIIYICVIKYFIPAIDIKSVIFAFVIIYLISFVYNGGFWNKKITLKRRNV